MKKVYSKFVRDRKKEFQIETSILVGEECKYVVKKNLEPEGEEHIHRINETYQLSCNQDLLCPCFEKNGAVYFEYLDGKSLAQKLLDALSEKSYDRVKIIAKLYNEITDRLCGENIPEFIVQDKRFEKVFGQCEDQQEEGYRDLIFDLTFDNIILQGDMPKIIDYEWRFSFPVSKEFIKFRAVYAFEMKYGKLISAMYSLEEFYNLFQIEITKKKVFLSYNNSFIDYVYGEKGYNQILKQYKKDNFDVPVDELLLRSDYGFEKKIFSILLNNIYENKDLFDDYRKFFKVTEKLKQQQEGKHHFIFSEEFLFEFEQFIKGNFEMIKYYKDLSENPHQKLKKDFGLFHK